MAEIFADYITNKQINAEITFKDIIFGYLKGRTLVVWEEEVLEDYKFHLKKKEKYNTLTLLNTKCNI